MKHGVVSNCKKVNVRTDANKESDVIEILDAGTQVVLSSSATKNGFYRVKTTESLKGYGYIMSDFVTILDAEG